jgi:hypothetical protein
MNTKTTTTLTSRPQFYTSPQNQSRQYCIAIQSMHICQYLFKYYGESVVKLERELHQSRSHQRDRETSKHEHIRHIESKEESI